MSFSPFLVDNNQPKLLTLYHFDKSYQDAFRFQNVFGMSHYELTGDVHNGRNSNLFINNKTSGELKHSVLSNVHTSGVYCDGLTIFGIRDRAHKLWVGVELQDRYQYYNSHYDRGLTYEDCMDRINNEINKRRGKWQLTAVQWLDYDDVSQILRIHIYKKFHMWDQSRELEPWLNTIISHQISNLLRNNYGNYSRPCLKCSGNEGGDLCSIYETQCTKCPLFAKWFKSKKNAYDTKLPVSLEQVQDKVFEQPAEHFNIERAISDMHDKMKAVLRPIEYRVYKFLYIDGGKEDKLAQILGFRTTENKRMAGYRQIKNLKDIIYNKARKLLLEDGLDVIW